MEHLKLLPLSQDSVEERVAAFRNFSDEVRPVRTLPQAARDWLMLLGLLGIGSKLLVISSNAEITFCCILSI